MKLTKLFVSATFGFCAMTVLPGTAFAEVTVECHSHNYLYTECQAPLDDPELIHQLSNASCIINRTWGFNRKTRRLWVSDGCAGVFADPVGYHHGRAGTYDEGARTYDERGHDNGALEAVLAGAIIGAALDHESHESHKKSHSTSNSYHHEHKHKSSGYAGCHGTGCLVDNPD